MIDVIQKFLVSIAQLADKIQIIGPSSSVLRRYQS